jgi:hypothetical protein
MAAIIFMLTCDLAEGFLLYVLVQFARELRQERVARVAAAAIPVSSAVRENTVEDRDFRKVIEITYRGRLPSHTSSRRMAS